MASNIQAGIGDRLVMNNGSCVRSEWNVGRMT